MPLYRQFETVEELDQQYLPALRVPEFREIVARWSSESERVGRSGGFHPRLGYGPTLDETVDVFHGPKGAPIHVFLHGGYWRAFAPKDFYFIAEQLVKDGFCVVLPNYSLCPKVSIDEIVRQVRACVKWLHVFADLAGADPTNITISGHSAGGHLTAMALLTDWQGEYGVDPSFIRGGIAVSGLYDLAPFPYTTLQPSLQLTWDQVARNSPMKQATAPCAPLVLTAGEQESEEFHRQMKDFAAHKRLRSFVVPDANHYTVLDAYLDRGSLLYREILTLAGRAP